MGLVIAGAVHLVAQFKAWGLKQQILSLRQTIAPQQKAQDFGQRLAAKKLYLESDDGELKVRVIMPEEKTVDGSVEIKAEKIGYTYSEIDQAGIPTLGLTFFSTTCDSNQRGLKGMLELNIGGISERCRRE